MARNKPKKLPFTFFLISLILHLFVFAAASHEYVWKKSVRTSRPLKFRLVFVEKPEEKLPPNPQSRFLSNANRKESGSGKPSKTPTLKREDRDLTPSRRGGLGPERASLSPASKSEASVPSVPSNPATPPVVAKPKPEPGKLEKSEDMGPPEVEAIRKAPKPAEMASLAPTPKLSVMAPSPVFQEEIQPKPKPPANETPEKIEIKAVSRIKPKTAVKQKPVKQVVGKKPWKESRKIEAKGENTKKLEMAALPPASKPKAQVRAPKPSRRNPPVDVTRENKPQKVEKSPERKPPDNSETTKAIKPVETTGIARTLEPSAKTHSSATQEEIQPKVVDKLPEKKRMESKELPGINSKPRRVAKKKSVNQVVRKTPRKRQKKIEAKKTSKEKFEVAALNPISPPDRRQRPAPLGLNHKTLWRYFE